MAAPKKPAGTTAAEWEKIRNRAIKKAREDRAANAPLKPVRSADWEKMRVRYTKEQRAKRKKNKK